MSFNIMYAIAACRSPFFGGRASEEQLKQGVFVVYDDISAAYWYIHYTEHDHSFAFKFASEKMAAEYIDEMVISEEEGMGRVPNYHNLSLAKPSTREEKVDYATNADRILASGVWKAWTDKNAVEIQQKMLEYWKASQKEWEDKMTVIEQKLLKIRS